MPTVAHAASAVQAAASRPHHMGATLPPALPECGQATGDRPDADPLTLGRLVLPAALLPLRHRHRRRCLGLPRFRLPLLPGLLAADLGSLLAEGVKRDRPHPPHPPSSCPRCREPTAWVCTRKDSG